MGARSLATNPAEAALGPLGHEDEHGVPEAIQRIRAAVGLPPLERAEQWLVRCRSGCGRVLGDRRASRYLATICGPCASAERETVAVAPTIPAGFRWASDWDLVRSRVSSPTAPWLAREALDSGERVIVLRGPSGAGKTSLACGLLLMWVTSCRGAGAEPRAARYATARELARAEREARLGSEPAPIAAAREAGLLVVDELGGDGAHGGEIIRAVLLDRDAAGRPTILATWLDVAGIGQRYGGGVARRCVASGAVVDLVADATGGTSGASGNSGETAVVDLGEVDW